MSKYTFLKVIRLLHFILKGKYHFALTFAPFLHIRQILVVVTKQFSFIVINSETTHTATICQTDCKYRYSDYEEGSRTFNEYSLCYMLKITLANNIPLANEQFDVIGLFYIFPQSIA